MFPRNDKNMPESVLKEFRKKHNFKLLYSTIKKKNNKTLDRVACNFYPFLDNLEFFKQGVPINMGIQ